MRSLLVLPVLVMLAACSPTTDVSRTSTEIFARRSGYRIVSANVVGDSVDVRARLESRAFARTIAEDIVVHKRIRYDRVDVQLVAPDGSQAGFAHWTTKDGFTFAAR